LNGKKNFGDLGEAKEGRGGKKKRKGVKKRERSKSKLGGGGRVV